jgi:hypothetical protein
MKSRWLNLAKRLKGGLEMKKFTVLAVLALMVAVALPVVAADFAFTGEITYGAINDFTNENNGYGNALLTASGKVDANTTVNFGISSNYTGAPLLIETTAGGTSVAAFTAAISTMDMVTDIGKALGLNGINIVSTIGWVDTAATSYSVSAYGNEGLLTGGVYDGLPTRDNVQFVVGMGAPISLQVSFAPFTNLAKAIAFEPSVLVDAYGVVGPLSYSVAYATAHAKVSMGVIGGAATFAMAFGDITPSINAEAVYDLSAPAKNALAWGAGLKVAYKTLATVDAAINGADAASALTAHVGFVPMASLGFDVGANFDLTTAAQMGIDASAWTLIGKSKVRVGYLYSKSSGADAYGNLNGPTATGMAKGGLYFNWDVTF